MRACRTYLVRLLVASPSSYPTALQLGLSQRHSAIASALCCDVSRRLVSFGTDAREQSVGHVVNPIDLSTKPWQPQVFTKQRTSFGGAGGGFAQRC